jgi:hypothetical protein
LTSEHTPSFLLAYSLSQFLDLLLDCAAQALVHLLAIVLVLGSFPCNCRRPTSKGMQRINSSSSVKGRPVPRPGASRASATE